MCMIDCGETYWPYRVVDRKARKPHKCDECGRDISIGETYRRVTGKYDDFWSTHDTCRHCCIAQEWLSQNCGGFLHQGVYEDIEEHVSEYPRLAFGLMRLAVGMRSKWRFKSQRQMPMPRLPASIKSVVVEGAPR